MQHLLPSSASGPGAVEIQATNYLYQTVTQQPVDEAEEEDASEDGADEESEGESEENSGE